MFHFKTRSLKRGIVAVALLAASALSIQPARAQAKAPTVAPKIDAAAREILNQMATFYKTAPSYAGNFSIQTSGFPDRFGIKARLSFARPSRFHIFSEDVAGTQKIVSDGEALIHTLSREPASYVRGEAPTGKGALQDALAVIGADGTALSTLLSGNDPLAGFGKSLQSVSLGEAQSGFDVVNVSFGQDNMSGTVTYLIGKDHVLQSVALSQTARGKTITSVETHSDVQIGAEIPDSTFKTEAPVEWQPLEKFVKPKYDPRLMIGGLPFDFPVKDSQGRAVSWDQYKGKVVLVDFWATWCPPCVEEAPAVVNTYNSFKDEGFDIIGVSLDQNRDALYAFAEQYQMPWRQIFDGGVWNSETPQLFGINSVPMTLLVGRDGKIAAIDVRGAQLTRAISKAISVRPSDADTPVATAVAR